MFTIPRGERIPILAPLRQQVTSPHCSHQPNTAPAARTAQRHQPSGEQPRAQGPLSASCLPVSLPHRLLLLRLADVPHVIQWEKQKVPVGGKPRQGEGSIELPEGQLGKLRGTRPGGTHAQHHRHAPENLLELCPGASPAGVARSAAGIRPSRRLGLRRARGVPGALLPWGKRRGWLTGGPPYLPLAAPDQGVSGSKEALDPTAADMACHRVRGWGGANEGLWQQLSEPELKQKTFFMGLVTLQDPDLHSVVRGLVASAPTPQLAGNRASQAPLRQPRS